GRGGHPGEGAEARRVRDLQGGGAARAASGAPRSGGGQEDAGKPGRGAGRDGAEASGTERSPPTWRAPSDRTPTPALILQRLLKMPRRRKTRYIPTPTTTIRA